MKVKSFVGVVLLAGNAVAKLRKRNSKEEEAEDEGFSFGEDVQIDERETIEVIIGLNKPDEEPTFTTMSNTIDLLSDSVSLEDILPQISSGVARVPVDMIPILRYDPRVKYIELNGEIYENSEFIPVGVSMSLGDRSPLDFRPGPGVSTECSDPESFKIAIVDGGIGVSHYDFEYCGVFEENGSADPNRETHCMGKAFLKSNDAADGQDWFNTKREHGMHVGGIIAASGLNGAGISGMIADEKFCLVVSRVFGDGGGATVAKVAEAIIWAADTGSKVINMSLGTSNEFSAVTDAIQYAYAKGAILVASAGNGADNDPPLLVNYPADYDEVLSIAAVDTNYKRASFSNFNENVNMSAVGVDVLSTYPLPSGGTNVEIVTSKGTFNGIHMIYSRYTSNEGTTGVLVDCGSGDSKCPGSGGHVCVIERGGSAYHTKVLQCEKSNAVAAIIYSDDETMVRGSMGQVNNSPQFTSIPAVGVSWGVGLQLLRLVGKEITITSPLEGNGYGRMSGTSMSSPMVSSAAGLLWRSCPDCSREEVIDCLLTTALDVGPVGKDIYYGSGVLNTKGAFTCLSTNPCCTGPSMEEIDPTVVPSSVPTGTPTVRQTPAPSKVPTKTPTISPTYLPTHKATKNPTEQPTSFPTRSASFSPTSSPSLRTAQNFVCDGHCADKHAFCLYKAKKKCLDENNSCLTSCLNALKDGLLVPEFLGLCEAEWCAEDEEKCISERENSCKADLASCQQFC